MNDKEQAILRAEQAHQLINNPMFEQAFKDTRNGIMEAWASLDSGDARKGEHAANLHNMVKCLDKVHRALKEHITTGRLASREIEGKKNLFGQRR